jgi:hypothetical protein
LNGSQAVGRKRHMDNRTLGWVADGPVRPAN